MTLREYADAIRKGDDPLAVLRVAVSEAESSALERAAQEADSWGCSYAARAIRAKALPVSAAPSVPKLHIAFCCCGDPECEIPFAARAAPPEGEGK